jgi:hypothetical protein
MSPEDVEAAQLPDTPEIKLAKKRYMEIFPARGAII